MLACVSKRFPYHLSQYFNFIKFCLFVFIQARVSLCSSSCPRTHYVDQVGLELIEIRLPLPPSAGIKDVLHHMGFVSVL